MTSAYIFLSSQETVDKNQESKIERGIQRERERETKSKI